MSAHTLGRIIMARIPGEATYHGACGCAMTPGSGDMGTLDYCPVHA